MKLIQLCLLLLFVIPLVSGVEIIDRTISANVETSQPMVVITYQENPIWIREYWINYTNPPEGIMLSDVDLSYVNDNCQYPQQGEASDACASRRYNFSMEGYLWDDDYTFFAKADDTDGNELEFYVHFTVKAQLADFQVESPRVPYDLSRKYVFYHELPLEFFMGIEPSYAISNCYLTYPETFVPPGNIFEPDEALFNYMRSQGIFEPIYAYPSGGPYIKNYTFAQDSFLGGSFYEEGDLEMLYVLCNESNQYLTRYHYGNLWVGYDTTPPVIEDFAFYPNTLHDPSNDHHFQIHLQSLKNNFYYKYNFLHLQNQSSCLEMDENNLPGKLYCQSNTQFYHQLIFANQYWLCKDHEECLDKKQNLL